MYRFLSNLSAQPARGGLRVVILLAALLTGWLVSGSAGAAEAEQSTTSEPEAEAEAEAESSSQPDQADSEKTTSSSEVFIPTEDISEDFAVSFPVDI